jgi:hypothetical protein
MKTEADVIDPAAFKTALKTFRAAVRRKYAVMADKEIIAVLEAVLNMKNAGEAAQLAVVVDATRACVGAARE